MGDGADGAGLRCGGRGEGGIPRLVGVRPECARVLLTKAASLEARADAFVAAMMGGIGATGATRGRVRFNRPDKRSVMAPTPNRDMPAVLDAMILADDIIDTKEERA